MTSKTNRTTTSRVLAVVEVGLVLALFLYLRSLLKATGFSGWQDALFGSPIASSALLFFVLPVAFVWIGGRRPGSCGLTTRELRYHWRVALRAVAVVLPTTMLFPLIGLLGSAHTEWLGATILSVGFVLAGTVFANKSQDLANVPRADLSWGGSLAFVALLVVGMVLSYLLQPWSALAARLIDVLVFVGFLEEFFFRGYVQSRLNDALGRPYRFRTVEFGAGMVIAAAAFGAFHPLTVSGDMPWAWGVWTTAGGLVFGFVREKTGAVVAPAILHGAIWIPGVLFGPG